MTRILITGMSGTGKSTTITALAARGYWAIDLDSPEWSEHGPDGDWIWQADRVRELLAHNERALLIVSGCAENQGQFYPFFDRVVLLSAPTPLIVERLKTRTTNQYGKDPAELAATLEYIETVEPLLRRGAHHEIDTSIPLAAVIARIEQIITAAAGQH